jgi:phospholipid/cholesterol/gamma-HCH transport system substrate-binding protein
MRGLDKVTLASLVKLVIFLVVTTLATGLLAITIGNLSFGSTTPYKAVFTDVTGLNTGDDVRVAGVRVGSVQEIEITGEDLAMVSFDADSDVPLTESTQAAIRYRNLVGQRYIALTPGDGGAGELASNDTIPVEQTVPALDLTVLFNGFKPLFEAMSPADVNQLAYEIIRVLQGEGGTVEALAARTASLTNALADRDQLIGDVIDNLDAVLTTLGNRDQELSATILRLQEFVSGLNQDRQAILGSLNSISDLAVQTADLVSETRPALTEDIRQLRGFAGTLSENRPALDQALKILPQKLKKVGRTATYGSWFNFYVCNFQGNIVIPPELLEILEEAGIEIGENGSIPIDYAVGAARCDLG